MTAEELEALIAKKLLSKHMAELTWSEIVSVVGGSSAQQKAALVQRFANNRGRQAGEAMQKAINAKMKSDAEAEAATMMADSSLSQTELERIFG